MKKESTFIPIIIDVERNIDGISMIRCSYFSIQSDNPMSNWTISTGGIDSPVLLLSIEAILLGSRQSPDYFRSHSDVDSIYDFIEDHEGLFIDINDIWVPSSWFGTKELKQGLLFRISQDKFSLCWKFRNDIISTEEFMALDDEIDKSKSSFIRFSENENDAFRSWTDNQIKQSQEIYQGNRGNYLQKIKQ